MDKTENIIKNNIPNISIYDTEPTIYSNLCEKEYLLDEWIKFLKTVEKTKLHGQLPYWIIIYVLSLTFPDVKKTYPDISLMTE